MNSDIQLAIHAEKTFNNKNNLLVTFHDHELNDNSFKKLHRNIKNVHILEPEFKPKTRYIVELKDLSEAEIIKDAILKSHYGKGHYTINCMNNSVVSYKHIDPFKLHVKNLPNSVTDREIKQLYPLCTQYEFEKSDSRVYKSVLVHFNNVNDAISAYKLTNRIMFRSTTLKVQFYRDKSKAQEDTQDEENTDSEDDNSKWEKIENECLKNKKVSETLLIKNFPSDTTGAELLKLYPECCEYKFVPDSSNKSKSAIVRFRKVEDAIKMYTASNNIFKSNILHIEFQFKADKKKSAKVKSKGKSRGNEDKEVYINKEERKSNTNLNDLENKLNEEGFNSKNFDNCVLHVENLPLAATNEDLLQLFPEHQQYQIIPDRSTNSSSAYVCFNSPFEAFQSYKTTKKNLLYKRKLISVKFKNKTLKLNPFALKRKSDDIEDKNKKPVKLKMSLNDSSENDDVILIGDVPNNVPKLISEDDIECKSEDEDYTDDMYADVYLDVDELDNDENISEDNDFQGIELDDDTVLPLDEDDF